MNSLSWLIYFAQVSGSLGAMFLVFGVLACIFCVVWVPIVAICNDGERLPANRWPLFPPLWLPAFALVLCLLGNLMPSTKTVYAIAASQVGEQVIKSEAVQGVANDSVLALRSWIQQQIKQEASVPGKVK